MRRSSILGIPIDRCSRLELRTFLRRAFTEQRTHRIVTLNPEMALAARRYPRYGAIIRTADLVTIDGVGILAALHLKGEGGAERITGTTVLEESCAIAVERGETAAFLLHGRGLTTPPILRAVLKQRWPALNIAIGAVEPNQTLDHAMAQAIAAQRPSLLVVNFGHPLQETWIARYVDLFPTVRVAVGIGGALDYLSGVIPTPPSWIRKLGLEWAWRFARQPQRLPRIINAVVKFPLLVLSRRTSP